MMSEASRVGADGVRNMFADIAGDYDFLNHFLSANFDKGWRRKGVKAVEAGPSDKVLDICSGTGDLAFEFEKSGADVIGMDFCYPMIELAHQKKQQSKTSFNVADSLHLPVRDNCVDICSVAFGIRNAVDLDRGLGEMHRVLRPGGRLLILEFTNPPGVIFPAIYGFYFNHILPRIANLISRSSAYTYLNKSVKAFPDAPDLSERIKATGFLMCVIST